MRGGGGVECGWVGGLLVDWRGVEVRARVCV